MKKQALVCLAVVHQVSAQWLIARNASQGASLLSNNSQIQGPASPNNLASNTLLNFNYKAFGDSFAAGIGAGSPSDADQRGGGSLACRRTGGAYPQVINRALGSNQQAFDFSRFAACSGATAQDISGQIDSFMDNTVDLVTVSLGFVSDNKCVRAES